VKDYILCINKCQHLSFVSKKDSPACQFLFKLSALFI